ncbi:MAG TPA: phage virion morphogenesis protein [Paraburkholderia sp.]|nr:phage virion morphogenesis protein [Paraburkholderia sp.]
MTIAYTDAPLRDVLGRLAGFGGERQHALLDALGQVNENATRLRFRQGVSPSGSPWKPSKRALKKGGQTLVESGRLRDSITHNVLSGDTGVEWGTNVVYGRIHQLGGTIKREAHEHSIFQRIGRDGQIEGRFVKRKKSNFERRVQVGSYSIVMPARPYLGVNSQDVADMQAVGIEHLEAAVKGLPPGGLH